MHPGRHTLTSALLKGEAERAVAPVAAVVSQSFGGKGVSGSHGLAIETNEVIDAQTVDIGIVSSALT